MAIHNVAKKVSLKDSPKSIMIHIKYSRGAGDLVSSLQSHYILMEKTHDIFVEVSVEYGQYTWKGALPKRIESQGLDLSDDVVISNLAEWLEQLKPENRPNWVAKSDTQWPDKGSQTYLVLRALYSGEWECRVCGPAAMANPQPAARLKVLKTRGYFVCSMRRRCENCSAKNMHDILVMLPQHHPQHGVLRKPMSDKLKSRIKKVLMSTEACFGVPRSNKELLIDHKFPSQRWTAPETDNSDEMTDDEIRSKFQLLSNQTNMMKSRSCDQCVRSGERGSFMGITWYYEGSHTWQGESKDDERGCLGCPWYDLVEWKERLIRSLNCAKA